MKVWLFALTGPLAAQWPAEKKEVERARERVEAKGFVSSCSCPANDREGKGSAQKSFKSFLFFSFFEILEKEKFGAQFYTLDFRVQRYSLKENHHQALPKSKSNLLSQVSL